MNGLEERPKQGQTGIWEGKIVLPERPVMPKAEVGEDQNTQEHLAVSLDRLVSRIEDFLNTSPSEPLLISGDWGAGKTSILLDLQDRIGEAGAGDGGRPTILFEAWHHESGEGLLPALMQRIWEAGPDEKKTKEEFKQKGLEILKLVLTASFAVAPYAATMLGAGKALTSLFERGTGAGLKKEADALGNPKDSLKPNPVDELPKQLARMITFLWGEKAEPVIFVDDLDRCSPEGTVILLDAIRLLVGRSSALRCRFIVALDDSVAVRAVSSKFHGIQGFDGYRYLEKIFPYTFRIPPLTRHEVIDLSKTLIERIGETSGGENLLEGDQRDALASALSNPLFANPRLIKRTINRFVLVIHFEKKEQIPNSGESDHALAKWIVACERWPLLRRLMQRYDFSYWKAMGGNLSKKRANDAMPGPQAANLLAEPGALSWLLKRGIMSERHLWELFRDAEERLGRLGL